MILFIKRIVVIKFYCNFILYHLKILLIIRSIVIVMKNEGYKIERESFLLATGSLKHDNVGPRCHTQRLQIKGIVKHT